MKKMMKKLIAMAAALVMIVTLLPAVGVNAAEEPKQEFDLNKTGTITITKKEQGTENVLQGAGFTLYQVVTFRKDNNGKIVVDKSAIPSLVGKNINDIKASDITLPSNAANAEAMYGDYKYGGEEETNSSGVAAFSEVPVGIYVVVESTTPNDTENNIGYYESVPFIISMPSTSGKDENDNIIGDGKGDSWVYTINATPKNSKITGDKEIVEIDGEELEGTASANIGDIITYKVTTKTPVATGTSFSVTDQLNNLKYANPLNLKVFLIGEGGAETEVTEQAVNDPQIDGNNTSFTLTFKQDWINANLQKDIAIYYDAEVTEDAKIGTDANTNKAILDFGNSSSVNTNEPEVYTYGFNLTKNGENETLAGVEFNLTDVNGVNIKFSGTNNVYTYDEDASNETLVTGAGGKLTVKGLAAGTYYLKEIKTNDKYTLLANPVKIVISNADGDTKAQITIDDGTSVNIGTADENGDAWFEIAVQNNKGFSLPETGGMGTYLFTIGGIVIMAGAAFALIAMKKRA